MTKYDFWVKRDAVLSLEMYKRFLFLKRKYGEEYRLPPSEEIDFCWHYHILDTDMYERDCLNIYGKILRHYPYFGIDRETDFNDLNKAFETTKELYLKEFNQEIVLTKTKYPQFINFIRKKIEIISDNIRIYQKKIKQI